MNLDAGTCDDAGLWIGAMALLGLDGDPVADLEKTHRLQQAVARMQSEQVRRAVSAGASWTSIAAALRMSEQLVRDRFAGAPPDDAPSGHRPLRTTVAENIAA